MKLYSKESQTTNEKLSLGSEDLLNEALTIQTNEIDLDIKELQQENKNLSKQIAEIKKLQEDIQHNMKLELSEDREKSQQAIEEYQTSISQKENLIKENRLKISELQENKEVVKDNF